MRAIVMVTLRLQAREPSTNFAFHFPALLPIGAQVYILSAKVRLFSNFYFF